MSRPVHVNERPRAGYPGTRRESLCRRRERGSMSTVVATDGLVCRSVIAGHRGVAFVRDVDLEVAPGKVLTLVGPNGAGKSTLLLTLAGLLPRLEGDVLMNGVELRSGSPRRPKAGLVLVPDDRSLFPDLSVAENLDAARGAAGPRRARCSTCSPTLSRAGSLRPAICPVASSRCSPPPGRSCSSRTCCSSTS